MGVLYDVYLRSCGEKWPKTTLGRVPTDALEWAGISRGLEETVVMHNDQGTSFRDIASLVEAHFARLASARQYEEAARIADQAIERVREISRGSRAERSRPRLGPGQTAISIPIKADQSRAPSSTP